MAAKTWSSRSTGHLFKTKPAGIIKVQQIVQVKKVALRRGIWYRALNRLERSVLDLTAKYVDTIRSSKLATLVMVIVEKLKVASESIVDRLVRSVGFPLAQKVSVIAVSWGNSSAKQWASDKDLARFMAVTHLNKGLGSIN